MAQTFKPGRANFFRQKSIQMIQDGKNEPIYYYITWMHSSCLTTVFFQEICEINSFIT